MSWLAAAVVLASGEVSVRIQERLGMTATIQSLGGVVRLEARSADLFVDGRRSTVYRAADGFALGGRRYSGALEARASGSRLVLINRVPVEDYVAGVVSAECPPGWPMAALKAQAVAARTVAAVPTSHPRGLLCDLTHCQAYAGAPRSETRQAALETRGQVLVYRGRPIRALYHAACGGSRASNQHVFGGAALPYLQEAADPFCTTSPHASWSVWITRSELSQAWGSPVHRLAIRDRGPGGWVSRFEIDGRGVPAYQAWLALGRSAGWGVLKSLNVELHPVNGGYRFEGKGLGHGVGLCQWGAKGRAEAGWDYRRILAAAYPGARMENDHARL